VQERRIGAAFNFSEGTEDMKKLILALAIVVAGCAASEENLNAVSAVESSRLPAPSVPLSSFASYELAPMTMSPEVSAKPEKVAQGKVLEAKIEAKLRPLLAEWASAGAANRTGTLLIQPELVRLRVVSGGARFFAGAFSGDSFIDLDLRLTDDAGNQIANPRINKRAGAMGGAWSVGKTDQNLHDYIAYITHRYMADNY
jgi:hypothetical protein